MADKIVQVTAPKITATNVVYSPKVVDLPVPKLAVGNAQPVKITTSVENPRLSGTVTNMGEDSVPNPYLFKRLNDAYTGTDTVSLRYLQTKFDEYAVSDLFSRVVDYRRVFQEAQVTNDSYKVFFVSKGLVTPIFTLDVPAKALAKPFVDLGTLLDAAALTVAKPIFSQVTYSEELVKVAYLKASSEIVVSAEDFRRTVDYVRSFQSVVDATDDFFGTANADDDQIARVGKTLVNWVTSSEIRSIDVSKTLNTQTIALEQKSVNLAKPLVSYSSLSSQTALNFTKPLVSTGTLADLHKYLLGKNLVNTTTTADQHTSYASKVLVDSSEIAEQKSAKLQKPLFSATVNSDTVIKTWLAQRQFVDQTVTSSQISFEFEQQLAQVFNAAEQAQKNLGKTLASNGVFTDTLASQVNYKRGFTDFVASTDDFFGSANVDDDQTARIGKNLLSWLLPSDQHSVFGAKVLNTQYFAGEQARLQTSKVLSSDFNNTDRLSYTALKQLTDLSNTQDQTAFETAKTLSTGFTSTDNFSRLVAYNRQIANTTTSADTASKLASKATVSLTAASDQATTQTDFKRLLASLTSNTEQVTKTSRALKQDLVVLPEQVRKSNTKVLATTLVQQDVLQKAPNKAISSQSTTSDVLTFFKFGNRIFSEIAATNDGGVINNQGYFAESYVEPGYAGTNTYFS